MTIRLRLADPPREYRTKEFAANNKSVENAIEDLSRPTGLPYTVTNLAATRAIDVSTLTGDAATVGAVLANLLADLQTKGLIR